MFGEAESENPRTGSPWDDFLSSSPGASSPTARDVAYSPKDGMCAVPKLVPEIEEGNVEYKLQLLSPTPARFAKLVTQLKWRLLEGGGQALYELGVADSGQLIGLCRRDLERSLETLEEMAGDIGASVIVVKEIEVPRVQRIGRWGPKTDGAMRMSKLQLVSPVMTPSISVEEAEDTSSSETDTADEDEMAMNLMELLPFGSGGSTPPSRGSFANRNKGYQRSDPSLPSSQSSPSVAPIDDDDSIFTLDLEISSVFKPRPVRKRYGTPLHPSETSTTASQVMHDNMDMCLDLGAEMEALSLRKRAVVTPAHMQAPRVFLSKDPNYDIEQKIEKKVKKRDRRNANRERRRLFNKSALSEEELFGRKGTLEDDLIAPIPIVAVIPSGVQSLVPSLGEAFPSPPASDLSSEEEAISSAATTPDEGDKMFIVEALVVRKMSVDEAFLDFEGFSILEV